MGLLLVFGPTIALAADLAGTFVGGGSDFAVFLQIVPAGEGRIMGRFRQVSVDNKGKPIVWDRPLSGGATNDSFVGKLEGNWENGGDIAISGDWKGGVLTVSNARGLRVSLQKGDEGQYNQRLNLLAKLGGGIQEQAAANAAAVARSQEVGRATTRLNQVRDRVARFTQQAPAHVERAAALVAKYPKFTQAVQAKLEALQAITARSAQAAGDRGGLAADINNLAIDARNLHTDVQNNEREFEGAAARLTSESQGAAVACKDASPARVEDSALLNECALVSATRKRLDETVAQARANYARFESRWKQEKAEQEAVFVAVRARMTQFSAAR
ncbi:hypothetical protein [Variovorax paradoxus]|uniref:hypothetical protein n=1 Tax=Variovorax paradoxus TaxID=34073 RepID=UPI001ABCEA91